MTALPLVFDAPKRAPTAPPLRRPFIPPSARAAVTALGLPAVPRRPTRPPLLRPLRPPTPPPITVLPASARESPSPRPCCRRCSPPSTPLEPRRRHHRQDALERLHDGTLVETVLMRYPNLGSRSASPARPAAAWPARSAPPARAACSATCPPPRSSSRRAPARGRGPRRVACGGRPALQRRVHGDGRAAGQLTAGSSRPSAASPRPPLTGSGSPRAVRRDRHGFRGRRPTASSSACRTTSTTRPSAEALAAFREIAGEHRPWPGREYR